MLQQKNDSILIYSYPHTYILEYNKALGLFDSRIKIVADPGRADFLLILNRIIGPRISNYLIGKKIAISAATPDNVWILSLFANHKWIDDYATAE